MSILREDVEENFLLPCLDHLLRESFGLLASVEGLMVSINTLFPEHHLVGGSHGVVVLGFVPRSTSEMAILFGRLRART